MSTQIKSGISVNTRILSYPTTGVQRYLLELLQRMPTEGVRQVAPKVPLSGARAHLWEQMILPRRVGGDLLWSPCNTGPLAVSNQVATLHDVVPIDHPEWLNARFAAWYRFLTPKLARRVKRIITDSEYSRSRIVEVTGVPEDKVVAIPLGVDARFGPYDGKDIRIAVQKLELPSNYYVLSLGSMEPRKNLGRLLCAWESIYRRLPEDVWLVVSGAKGKSMVFQDVPELKMLPPRVFLTGHVSDELLPSLYAGAIAFAYPSVYEGFGLPPLEAMASGVPVLTGNRASLPEVVGDAGIMVDPYDVDAIADGLSRLIEDGSLRSQLRAKGLEQARMFSWDKTAERTWAILEAAAQE